FSGDLDFNTQEANKTPFSKPVEDTDADKIKKGNDFKVFSRTFTSSLLGVRDKVNKYIANGGLLDTENLLNSVDSLFSALPNDASLFDMLMCINQLDDVTYVHSIKVSLICKLFAEWLKMSPKDATELELAGLLHDIGKNKISQDIIRKTGKLTEEEYSEMRNHCLYGYNMLKTLPISEHVMNAALMHHERCDGSGYPLSLTGDAIDPFAKIVAIADVYDAMTTARSYRGPICPLEVINLFEKEGLTKYDPHYILVFLDNIMYTYLNHTVYLSNGMTGEVIMVNRNNRSKPIIKMENGEFLDLNKDSFVSVLGIL
ncbi:MAG: HD-GYP domain-containing protein, partial [Lachnospiraceae bacterium]|nr:HD-GYP domain-containing protein [Lachnospiraceae bacterium]